MSLATPEQNQTLRRRLCLEAKWVSPAHALRRSLVREPDAGNPHVRFDERGQETELWRGTRHRHSTATPLDLKPPRLSSTLPPGWEELWRPARLPPQARSPRGKPTIKLLTGRP